MTLIQAAGDSGEIFSRRARRLGALWVAVSIPFITVTSALVVDSPDSYVLVLIHMSCGAFTAPALWAVWYATRRAEPRTRPGGYMILAGLATAVAIGVATLIGLATGWRWANPAGVPAIALTGLLHILGLLSWTHLRSGARALSVDLIEATTAILAVTAPLVVLWAPAVAEADAAWFAQPAAAATVCTIAATYWTLALFVRLGPTRGPFEVGAIVLTGLGAVNAALQTAQGVSGFDLPAPPLIALNALCFSMYLLIPLNAPALRRPGLDVLPPQSQVRGARLATGVTLTGLAALWFATRAVADARPWTVTFSFIVASLLLVLTTARQMATAHETRRLYRQVEEASDERQRLLTQLFERSLDDRRHFAGELYAQAIAAHASFDVMTSTGLARLASPTAIAEASARIGDHFAQHARSAHDLTRALRPLETNRDRRQALDVPLRAYLTTIYGDCKPPHLTIDTHASPDMALDWTTETALLQVTQEALRNIWRHSHATTIDASVRATADEITLRITDNGTGFDPSAVPEGPGIATMRAAASVAGGTLTIDSRPRQGTTVLACVQADRPPTPPHHRTTPPRLRLVQDDEAHDMATVTPPDPTELK